MALFSDLKLNPKEIILNIIKEYGISLREGSGGVKAYYEIAKTAYQEGFMAGLKK